MSEKLHTKIGGELARLGGVLRCRACGAERALSSPTQIGGYLDSGWPMCHGETMEWLTQRQLDAGAGTSRPKVDR